MTGQKERILAEFKPCPFCGQYPVSSVVVTEMGSVNGDCINFLIKCEKCGTNKGVVLKLRTREGTFAEIKEAMEQSISVWNTRV